MTTVTQHHNSNNEPRRQTVRDWVAHIEQQGNGHGRKGLRISESKHVGHDCKALILGSGTQGSMEETRVRGRPEPGEDAGEDMGHL